MSFPTLVIVMFACTGSFTSQTLKNKFWACWRPQGAGWKQLKGFTHLAHNLFIGRNLPVTLWLGPICIRAQENKKLVEHWMSWQQAALSAGAGKGAPAPAADRNFLRTFFTSQPTQQNPKTSSRMAGRHKNVVNSPKRKFYSRVELGSEPGCSVPS